MAARKVALAATTDIVTNPANTLATGTISSNCVMIPVKSTLYLVVFSLARRDGEVVNGV